MTYIKKLQCKKCLVKTFHCILFAMAIFTYSLKTTDVMSQNDYSDKLAHEQVLINCLYSVAQMCAREATHASLFSRAALDHIMSQYEFITKCYI